MVEALTEEKKNQNEVPIELNEKNVDEEEIDLSQHAETF